MNILITICARAGSKGLPGKATKTFNGKPLCQWTMEQAFDFGKGKVVVSSDDPMVLSIARDMGLDYFTRASSLCQDDPPKLDVLRDILNKFGADKFDCVMDLDITNPCRTLEDMNKCVEIFKEKRPKTLFSVTKARKSPFFNQVFYDGGFWETIELRNPITSRQQAPESCDLNSCIYIYDADWLLEDKNHLSPITNNSEIYLMPDWTFCDIDNEVDFFVAEKLHKKYMAQA